MSTIPVIAFSGFSGSGKTTLIEKLLPALRGKGITTAVIKHDAHGLKFDTDGKDSARFSAAGADCSLVNGPGRTAIFINRQLTLEESVHMIQGVDLILIEGYKHCSYPRIGIDRAATGKGLTEDPSCFTAIVSDKDYSSAPVPSFDINDTERICSFIVNELQSFSK